MNLDLKTLRAKLEADGFKIVSRHQEYNDCTWYAFRRSKLQARSCEHNANKPGMQIVVLPIVYVHRGTPFNTIDVELSGQYGSWWKFLSYGNPFEDFMDQLPKIEAGLIRSWNALKE